MLEVYHWAIILSGVSGYSYFALKKSGFGYEMFGERFGFSKDDETNIISVYRRGGRVTS